jgi:hypothetical protein
MPPVHVAECETAADVWRLARESEARRKKWKQQLPKPPPPPPPPKEPEPEVIETPTAEAISPREVLWLGRSSAEIWAQMLEAQRLAPQNIDEVHPRPFTDDIIRAVARAYGFGSTDLKAARRDTLVCQARHVSMLICKLLTLRSYPKIGRAHGGRDHTTVLYAVEKLRWLGLKLQTIHTLADPPSAWAASAARLHPLPAMARTYIRRLPAMARTYVRRTEEEA